MTTLSISQQRPALATNIFAITSRTFLQFLAALTVKPPIPIKELHAPNPINVQELLELLNFRDTGYDHAISVLYNPQYSDTKAAEHIKESCSQRSQFITELLRQLSPEAISAILKDQDACNQLQSTQTQIQQGLIYTQQVWAKSTNPVAKGFLKFNKFADEETLRVLRQILQGQTPTFAPPQTWARMIKAIRAEIQTATAAEATRSEQEPQTHTQARTPQQNAQLTQNSVFANNHEHFIESVLSLGRNDHPREEVLQKAAFHE